MATSAARAIAIRCSTALVEPPSAITTTIAFSNAARVMMSRGLRSRSSKLRIAAPARKHSSSLAGSSAGVDELYGSDMPSASIAEAIVFAVYIPPQAPAPGHAFLHDRSAAASHRFARQRIRRNIEMPRQYRAFASVPLAAFGNGPADRAAIDHERRPIHAAPSRSSSPACSCRSRACEMFASYHCACIDGFDRIGNQIARLQRVAHALGAHRNAVADADRVESHPDQCPPP